ncbi:bifunctional phosphoribosylaminoimidazolecarboxamide formyltransferase/inosine monophosphate cyclohydrolase [Gracilinema caldarium]|uniref:Bifunctional purine biosynthesis protein PurH n=1 Tax=Gracilinema caldarium (strain ATCC 51460 / DSM 7334 / H1) TaxID=744872 RepID=F8F479_GRAC1|nr:bifunctional phosphoribosylaminoimidazolecarboxamide formyltransferase/inosine monophosphate cyclohydrolase [Gracilinema caldarium]AEJ20526.1 Bifunctional purine biosynthesis protein purH [Gracilinema caldarium DSM 7334]
MKKRALLSVFDKTGIAELARFLVQQDWELLSTGGTAKYLKDQGLPVTDVSAVTGFPECLDGRVKTLHPAIHAGLLARRDLSEHMETLKTLGLGTIDLVCVNLYPFFEKVQAGLSLEDTVEFIDIGGPTMLRSAAKNFAHVLVLTDPTDYAEVQNYLSAGEVPIAFRKRLAGKVFNLTSAYDGAISRYLLEETYPQYWPLSLVKKQSLRYGENAHQSAALYVHTDSPGALGTMEQLQGKELSYNNIRDLDLAWKAACALGVRFPKGTIVPPLGYIDEELIGRPAASQQGSSAGTSSDSAAAVVPTAATPVAANFPVADFSATANPATADFLPACVAVKHNTPCGVALGSTLLEAYEKAYACDPVSIFGGIVACTSTVDAATAQRLAELFLEIVVAPDFTSEALEIFRAKKNLRVMRATLPPQDRMECISVDGGLLVQSRDNRLIEKWEVVTQKAPDPSDIDDMLFGMRVVTYVKSNAIVVVKDGSALGIGGGQTNRIWAASQALERAATVTGPADRARVLASDAFFPFADVVEAAAAAGITTIIQPGGSIRDKESIEAADRLGIAMVFTGCRHFKH